MSENITKKETAPINLSSIEVKENKSKQKFEKKCKKLKIPHLWKRKSTKYNKIYYVSPSGHVLDSLNKLNEYLKEPNTCKCFMQNLAFSDVFNFDPSIQCEQLKNHDKKLSLCEDWAQSIGDDFYKCQLMLTSVYLIEQSVFDFREIYQILNKKKPSKLSNEPVASTSKDDIDAINEDDYKNWLRYYDIVSTLVTKNGLVLEHNLSSENLKHLAYELTAIGEIGINQNVPPEYSHCLSDEDFFSDDDEFEQVIQSIRSGSFKDGQASTCLDNKPPVSSSSKGESTKKFQILESSQSTISNLSSLLSSEKAYSKKVLIQLEDSSLLDKKCKDIKFDKSSSSYHFRVKLRKNNFKPSFYKFRYIAFDPDFLKYFRDFQRLDIESTNICEQETVITKDDLNLNSTLIEDESDSNNDIINRFEMNNVIDIADGSQILESSVSHNEMNEIGIHQSSLQEFPETVDNLQDISLSPINNENSKSSIQLYSIEKNRLELMNDSNNIVTNYVFTSEVNSENSVQKETIGETHTSSNGCFSNSDNRDLNLDSLQHCDDFNLSSNSSSSSTMSIDSLASTFFQMNTDSDSTNFDCSSEKLNSSNSIDKSKQILRRRSVSLDELRRNNFNDTNPNGYNVAELNDNLTLAEVMSREKYYKRLKRLKRELEIQGMPGNELEEVKVRLSPPLPPQERLFNVGDLVWGQREDVRYWPGKLVSFDDVSGELANSPQLKDQVIYCIFNTYITFMISNS